MTIRLGEFISQLEHIPPTHEVCFDFCDLVPTTIQSWRGDYSHLALGFSEDATQTVGGLLTMARATLGEWFEGYKGGSYLAGIRTPLWVSLWGRSTSTAIRMLRDNGHSATIVTESADD